MSLREARERRADLLDEVERGADVLITREGAPALRPASTQEQLGELARFRENMPPWRKSTAELIREMRDEG